MNLLSLKAENLFSLGRVDIDLCDRGLVLITGFSEDEGGFNGSGKSSLANKAILWTLWGETAGGVKADAVLNRHGKKKCFGEIQFNATNGVTYLVRRERPAKLTLLQSDEEEVWKDVSAATAKDTQELIDSLLGCNFQTFLQTSFFGQGRNLHYPSLPPKDQKAVLEQILPMEQVDRWAQYADGQIKTLTPKYKETEVVIQRLGGRAETLQTQLGKCQQDGVTFEENRQRQLEVLKTQIGKPNAALESKLRTLEFQHDKVRHVDIAASEVRLEELRGLMQEALTKKDEATAKNTEASLVARQWANALTNIEGQIKNLEKDAACAQCKRPFDNQEQVRIQLVELELVKAKNTETYEQAHAAWKYWDAEKQTAAHELSQARMAFEDLTRLVDARKSYDFNKSQMQTEIDALDGIIQQRIEDQKNAENPYLATFTRLESEIVEAKAALKSAEDTFLTVQEELDHLTYWKNVYGKEIKLKLFEEACPFLDAAVTYHLGRLKNEQIHCEFSTIKRLASGEVKEEFNVNVWSETGGKGFDSLSGGEQQMTSFAIGLALADLASRSSNTKSGFMILDEPFTELDARNGEAVVEYLTSEVGEGRNTIILISNDEPLKGLVQNRIHVVKKGGVTHVSNS